MHVGNFPRSFPRAPRSSPTGAGCRIVPVQRALVSGAVIARARARLHRSSKVTRRWLPAPSFLQGILKQNGSRSDVLLNNLSSKRRSGGRKCPPLAIPLRNASGVGSEEARLRAGHRPPLKLHVQFSRMQLSRRRPLPGDRNRRNQLDQVAQARTRRTAWSAAAVSSRRTANACIDATKCAARSSASSRWKSFRTWARL